MKADRAGAGLVAHLLALGRLHSSGPGQPVRAAPRRRKLSITRRLSSAFIRLLSSNVPITVARVASYLKARGNLRMKFVKVLVCLAIVFAGPNVFAQQITGSIRGTVTDASGAVVEGATVSARQAETGLTRTTTTDHLGDYI